jgi:hypothetical protein
MIDASDLTTVGSRLTDKSLQEANVKKSLVKVATDLTKFAKVEAPRKTGNLARNTQATVTAGNQINFETSDKVKTVIGSNIECRKGVAQNSVGEIINLAFCNENVLDQEQTKILDSLLNDKDEIAPWSSLKIENIEDGSTIWHHHKLLEMVYGEDYGYNIPKMNSSDLDYLYRVIQAVREAFEKIEL